jgi:hypothetical protein
MIETPIPVDPIPVSSQLHVDDAFVSFTVSTAEAMNPTRRNTMEDRYVIHAPGTWNAPDPDMAYLAVYDGHGGKYDPRRLLSSYLVAPKWLTVQYFWEQAVTWWTFWNMEWPITLPKS